MANPGTRVDAFPAFHFEVDIGGSSYPFRTCSGLSSETKVYEVEEGGVNGYVHKLVDRTTFPNLVLGQGFCNPSSPLYALYQAFIADGGTKKRFDGFVRAIGPNGTSAKWVFKNGWIAKWSSSDFDATQNQVAIETIEIVHEGLQLVGGSAGGMGTAGGSTSGGLLGGLLGGVTGGISGSVLGVPIGGSSSSSGASSSSSSTSSSGGASSSGSASSGSASSGSASSGSASSGSSSTTSSSTSSSTPKKSV